MLCLSVLWPASSLTPCPVTLQAPAQPKSDPSPEAQLEGESNKHYHWRGYDTPKPEQSYYPKQGSGQYPKPGREWHPADDYHKAGRAPGGWGEYGIEPRHGYKDHDRDDYGSYGHHGDGEWTVTVSIASALILCAAAVRAQCTVTICCALQQYARGMHSLAVPVLRSCLRLVQLAVKPKLLAFSTQLPSATGSSCQSCCSLVQTCSVNVLRNSPSHPFCSAAAAQLSLDIRHDFSSLILPLPPCHASPSPVSALAYLQASARAFLLPWARPPAKMRTCEDANVGASCTGTCAVGSDGAPKARCTRKEGYGPPKWVVSATGACTQGARLVLYRTGPKPNIQTRTSFVLVAVYTAPAGFPQSGVTISGELLRGRGILLPMTCRTACLQHPAS